MSAANATTTSDDSSNDLLTADEIISRVLAEPSLRGQLVTCVVRMVKHQGQWCARRSDLEAWIADHKRRGGGPEGPPRHEPLANA
jgi:hypothetical protein